MKTRKLLSILVLFSLVLAVLPAPLAAQQPVGPSKMPQPTPSAPAVPTAPRPAAPQQAAWHVLPAAPFQFTRFDGAFVPGPEPWGNKIYFLGGRDSGSTEDPSVWMFDPATLTWTDTGDDIVEDVSNYTAHLINDDGTGNGPALYIIGGYSADTGAGVNIGTVQRYYPQTGVAEALPAADDWTPTVAGNLTTANGQATVDDVIYVFGGWENLAEPYFYSGTWAFDPQLPSGSRWTNLNLTLTPARSYIQVAVQDGVIYAMGGIDQYVGGDLVPTTVVEALDTNNIVAGWQARAPLPVASGEGRGFGFDADTLAPVPWDGHVYLAGGGDWNGRSAEAMEYLTEFDSWDQAFPDLNQARRDHAGTFVPLCTEDPDDGLPGLWVFGGNIAGDTPPFGDPEYYPLECAQTCNVLLVDDDWDFDQTVPNDGGRPYYTSTLDALGFTYDVWDTISQGQPATADMAPYDIVLWFTGYAWEEGVFSPTNEADVAAYLDGGGKFLLSSADYHYEVGTITPFMANYLGVSDMTDDVAERDPVGNAGNPIGGGLGPYTMVRPDLWAAYWPTGTYEGPWDDYANAGPSADEPFRYNATGQNNSTNLDGGAWKTIFLAWPFEWIGDQGDRADILGAALNWLCFAEEPAGMSLLPPAQAGTGAVGSTVDYTLTVVNDMGAEGSFTITYSSIWPVTGPDVVGPISDGGQASFVVEVTTPAEANCLDQDTATVQAFAQSNPAYSDTALLNTSIVAGSGDVAGTVFDANTGLGIADAYVELYVGDYVIDHWTWADANGDFTFTGIEACNYTGFASGVGYYNLDFGCMVAPVLTNTLAITLDAGMPDLSDTSVSVSVPPSGTTTYSLDLANNGTADLNFHISEIPADSVYPRPAVANDMPSGVDAQVYRDLAASTDGTARFIVYMRDQADLSAAFGIKDWSARGHYVLDALRQTAARSQAGLRVDLDKAGVGYESRYIVNALVVEGNRSLVDSIVARPEVAFIGPNTAIPAPAPVTISPAPDGADVVEWNIQRVKADAVWTDFGVTGAGMVVSNIDTGVQYTHLALVNQYRGNLGGGNYDHNYNWWDPYGQNTAEPTDSDGHGTHTMGTMAGSDNPTNPISATNAIGVAPGAQWMACDGFDNITGVGYSAELLECAEFILAPWNLTGTNPMPDMRPDVVNNSWGGGQAQWWYGQSIYAWRAAGIFPSFSIGNDGASCGSAGDPGDSPNVISSGATDINDHIAGFSSRGPALVSGITKPDVSAPGVNIRSSVPGGYASIGGTSMASPHTAAEAALIWSAVPALRGNVQLTYWIIEHTALGITTTQGCGGDTPSSIPNNVFGWGRIDTYEAVNLALSSNWDIPWLAVDPVQGVITPGASTTVNLDFDALDLPLATCVTGTLKFEFNDPYVTEFFMPVEMCVVGEPDIVPPPPVPPAPLYPGMQANNSFTVVNTGTADLNWSLSESPDAPWLEEVPTSATTAPGAGTTVMLTYTAPLTPGIYTTDLLISSNDPDQPVVTVTIEMDVAQPCVPVQSADFTRSPFTPTMGVAATFNATYTPLTVSLPIEFTWDFGDGTGQFVTNSPTITHTFAFTGTYTVALTVTNSCTTALVVATHTLTVRPQPVPEYKIYLPIIFRTATR